MISLSAQPIQDLEYPLILDRANDVKDRRGRSPKLAVVLVGAHAPSEIYVASKAKRAKAVGIDFHLAKFPADISEVDLADEVSRLNLDADIDGIIIQRPLPSHISEEKALFWVAPAKDVDGLHPENLGRVALGLPGLKPCTPWGVIALLKHYRVPLAGHTVCIVGRSGIVGKPLQAMLLQEDMTVLHAHSKTKDLRALTLQADLIVMAIGKPNFLKGDMVKKGAVVVDVGINRLIDGKVVGDADFTSVSKIASAVTPVPGSVGPMTILTLMKNTVLAAENSISQPRKIQ